MSGQEEVRSRGRCVTVGALGPGVSVRGLHQTPIP